jgi:hypothetical protein
VSAGPRSKGPIGPWPPAPDRPRPGTAQEVLATAPAISGRVLASPSARGEAACRRESRRLACPAGTRTSTSGSAIRNVRHADLRLDGTEVSQEILGRERCRPLADLPGTGLDDPPLAFGRLGEVHTTNGERTDTPASANWLTSMSTPALGVRGFVGEPEARLGLDAGGSQEAAQQCATGPGRAAGQVRLDRTYRDHLVS